MLRATFPNQRQTRSKRVTLQIPHLGNGRNRIRFITTKTKTKQKQQQQKDLLKYEEESKRNEEAITTITTINETVVAHSSSSSIGLVVGDKDRKSSKVRFNLPLKLESSISKKINYFNSRTSSSPSSSASVLSSSSSSSSPPLAYCDPSCSSPSKHQSYQSLTSKFVILFYNFWNWLVF